MFSQAVIENIGCYVYFLQDPRNSEIFYIGKGTGNRVFEHVACAENLDQHAGKLDRIRDIIESGKTVKQFILRHGLTEEIAFEVEASLIDFVGRDNLLNMQDGHYSKDYGLKSIAEISAIYDAEEFNTNEPVILININRYYRRDMSEEELYEATRKFWVVSSRREKAKYAVATYKGLTREVYVIDSWYPKEKNKKKTRWGFKGNVAPEEVRTNLIHKSIKSLFKFGAANPIKYFNC